MKNNMKKGIVSMVVVGMTLTGAAGVYAGASLQKISAYLNGNISVKVDGAAYTLKDENGHKLSPIMYQDKMYLPVRSLAGALHTPIQYDSKNNQVLIGKGQQASEQYVEVKYSDAQIKAIKKEFAAFDGFETAYAPKQMAAGDTFVKSFAGGDGVSVIFNHMTVNVSPRDYSDGYESKEVVLSNGVKAKWYTPSDLPMLSFQLDDRTITISSPDQVLTQAQMEKIAVSVAKL
ncbi:hypothetical protein [Paenibacillus sp. FSL H8-0537]|uniref:stalk domain-containing protein n=1 Tax=Paenibacillus sp. FSL H8-0537 TaxID=2921399 RepID=UPI00310120AA